MWHFIHNNIDIVWTTFFILKRSCNVRNQVERTLAHYYLTFITVRGLRKRGVARYVSCILRDVTVRVWEGWCARVWCMRVWYWWCVRVWRGRYKRSSRLWLKYWHGRRVWKWRGWCVRVWSGIHVSRVSGRWFGECRRIHKSSTC